MRKLIVLLSVLIFSSFRVTPVEVPWNMPWVTGHTEPYFTDEYESLIEMPIISVFSGMEWKDVFRENFTQIDKDKNGVVTIAEFSQTFLTADTNGDGSITLAEYLKAEELVENHAVLTEDFNFNDKNKDGVVNYADFQQQFDDIDTNHDHVMEQNEFVLYAEELLRTRGHPAFGK